MKIQWTGKNQEEFKKLGFDIVAQERRINGAIWVKTPDGNKKLNRDEYLEFNEANAH